jgi:hypothetical protein
VRGISEINGDYCIGRGVSAKVHLQVAGLVDGCTVI